MADATGLMCLNGNTYLPLSHSSEFKNRMIQVAVIGSGPLRFAGFSALLSTESDFQVTTATLPEGEGLHNVDVILLSDPSGRILIRNVARLKAARPDLRIVATGSGTEESTVLDVLASGAKGYVDEAAPAAEFVQAIRVVNQGSLWASRRILSMFIERANQPEARAFPLARVVLTAREREVLEMLVAGNSNKEIAEPLGIEVRTVKAHISKLLRKTGVRNRIALSTYAIDHAIVASR
jgi:DNA-binding NarL/FixJ family response regulator